tara:strand:- start:3333 stop:4436 length:1104 start_codon:yes stop_codon:yes gene_type:complete
MSEKDQYLLNGDYNLYPMSKEQFPETFLEEGEDFTDRLSRLVKDSTRNKGDNINVPTIGKVLAVKKTAPPTPGGPRSKINDISNAPISTCLQIYVHTKFDIAKPIPRNLINPGKESTLIYQHPVYEALSSELDSKVPNVGDEVYVLHPLAHGYLNRVGTYLGIVAKGGVPLAKTPVKDKFSAAVQRKTAIPLAAPPEPTECEKDPYGADCAWRKGRLLGKIDLEPIPSVIRPNLRLKKEVADAYKQMRNAAKNDGIRINATDGFRSYKEQQKAKEKWTKKGKPGNAATPGYSRHQAGIAVDISTWVNGEGKTKQKKGSSAPNPTTAIYRWLQKNAHKYGFVRTVSQEPWHWVYYGPNEAAKRRPSWT